MFSPNVHKFGERKKNHTILENFRTSFFNEIIIREIIVLKKKALTEVSNNALIKN